MISASEERKAARIQAVVNQHSGRRILRIIEVAHWLGWSSTQIYHMRRRGNLPPQYTYEIEFEKEEQP